MEVTRFEVETAAEAYLAVLRDRGIKRLFVNAGTDFAPIVEAYARQEKTDLEFPEVVVCPHENLAISMAHGAYLGDGEPQVVMLHTSVGTANGVCGIYNAAKARIPLIVTAGRTPVYERDVFGSRDSGIHWAQEMYDQAGMVRELVKWDYELRGSDQIDVVIERAIDIAMTEPRGPVYLSLPREVLATRIKNIEVTRRLSPFPTNAYPEPVAIDEIAERLLNARFPVLVASSSGVDPSTVPLLDAFAEKYAIGLAETGRRHLNFSPAHPLNLGGQIGAVFQQADVICFLDVDAPWIPNLSQPRDETFVAQCGPDPHFSHYPIRSHRSDLSITTSTKNLLTALDSALEPRVAAIDPLRHERIGAVARDRAEREAAASLAESTAAGKITSGFMSWALEQVMPPDALIVNELGSGAATGEPGTQFAGSPAGGLGWGLPAALGLCMTRRDRLVIATLGDGSYIFANPSACHLAMAMHDLPVLVIVSTNHKWNAVARSATRVYPEGYAAASSQLTPLARLDPSPAFEKYAEASGGYGEFVSERSDLVPALERALHAVRFEHRHALINVDCV